MYFSYLRTSNPIRIEFMYDSSSVGVYKDKAENHVPNSVQWRRPDICRCTIAYPIVQWDGLIIISKIGDSTELALKPATGT